MKKWNEMTTMERIKVTDYELVLFAILAGASLWLFIFDNLPGMVMTGILAVIVFVQTDNEKQRIFIREAIQEAKEK